jgi:hypothetical protein
VRHGEFSPTVLDGALEEAENLGQLSISPALFARMPVKLHDIHQLLTAMIAVKKTLSNPSGFQSTDSTSISLLHEAGGSITEGIIA